MPSSIRGGGGRAAGLASIAPSRSEWGRGHLALLTGSRARVTQLFDLLMIAADLQEQVMAFEAVDGAEPMAERTLREVAHAGTWAEQRSAWRKLSASGTRP